jgi:hypothetical protein
MSLGGMDDWDEEGNRRMLVQRADKQLHDSPRLCATSFKPIA